MPLFSVCVVVCFCFVLVWFGVCCRVLCVVVCCVLLWLVLFCCACVCCVCVLCCCFVVFCWVRCGLLCGVVVAVLFLLENDLLRCLLLN